MLCCLGSPWANPHDEYNRQTAGGAGSSFPGNRRFVKTGGNALAAAPPPSQHGGAGCDMVSVTVPPGVSAGQAIQVAAPDGSGRMVMANVPQGMSPGSTFMVQFPSNHHQAAPQSAAVPVVQQPEQRPVDYSNVVPIQPPTTSTTPAAEPFIPTAVPVHDAAPGATTIPAPYPSPTDAGVTHIPPPNHADEKRLLVRVPPGTLPGTTLHVTIPDEPGRMVAAQVPPGNVREFYVSYQPRNTTAPPRTAVTANNLPQNRARMNRSNGYNGNNRNNNNNNRGGGLGSMFLPFLGGTALGAAGMGAAGGMFSHNHQYGHDNNNAYYNENNGNGYANDAYNDDGGAYEQQDAYDQPDNVDAGDYGGEDCGGGDFGGFGDY